MNYVDGFLIPVSSDKRQEYIDMARKAAQVLKECGALSVTECWGDDVPPGKLTSFPMAVKLEANETVVFSWVTWPSKAVRDEGSKKFMADPRMQPDQFPMFIDGKRMIFGGFEIIVEA